MVWADGCACLLPPGGQELEAIGGHSVTSKLNFSWENQEDLLNPV